MDMNKQNGYIVVGAGLTGLTTAFYLKKAGVNVQVVERNPYTGGVIQTHTENGFTYESGPNTGVLSSAELVELFEDLDLEPEIADEAAKQRWIWKKGKWNPLPSGPVSAVTTPLFSMKDKIRILGEPFRKPGDKPYETVAELVIRRMGRSFLDYAVDPFISGIYAGDPGKLVTQFALPKLYRLEQDYGSFIKGAMKKRSEPKDPRDEKVTKDVFSVKGGLGKLIGALTDAIGADCIHTGCTSVAINPANGGYACVLKKESGESLEIPATNVITTTGGFALPEILPFLGKEKLAPITALKYARVIQAVAGYKNWTGIHLNAFGGLVPGKEKRDVLGILFPSAIFENRAPQGGALLSVFMGGMKRPDLFELSEAEIRKTALREIRETLQPKNGDPDMLRIFRYPHAIPQYDRSSEERLERIIQIEEQNPGLLLAGNIRDGIGISDRVKQGRVIADALIAKADA